jgi:hypothetical protein
MKKFLTTISLLLLAVACAPTPTPEPEAPSFPEAVTEAVLPGNEFTLNIAPNYDWEVSLSESSVAYFQIKDGQNAAYRVRGTAGEHSIVIAVADVQLFDEQPVCEVTMTMQGQSKVIATLTMTATERVLKIYPVAIEDGAFAYATEGEQTYAYLETEVTADGMTMIWPAEMALYSTRVKVESNFNWIVDGAPEWITPIEGGTAGVTELWIKGDETKYPLSAQSATLNFIDAVATDKLVSSLKITIPAATDIFTVEGLTEKTEFNFQGHIYSSMIGEYVEGGAIATVLGVDGSSVVAVEFTEAAGLVQAALNPQWLTIDYAAWDSSDNSVIQKRALTLSATVNDGAARKATVLILPQGVAADNIDLIALNGAITDEYKPYVATIVEQAGDPGSIEIVGEQTMESSGNSIEQLDGSHWIFGLFPGVKTGYDVLYTSQWAYEDWYVNVARPYTEIKCYSFDTTGATVELSGDTAWITTTVFGTNSEKVRIVMDKSKPTAAPSQNLNTGDYEGVVTFADQSGIFALIFCRYNEAAAQISTGVSFYYPDYAAQQNSTLVELTSGELYTKYASYGEKVYHLTYTTATPNLSMLKGLPQTWGYVNEADKEWLKYEYSEDSQMVTMDAQKGNGKTGALVFGEGSLVLICTLNIAQ